MEWIALIAWLLTAVGGFILLSIWVARGGMQAAREPGSKIRPGLILSHFALAATGLVLWIIFVATDSDALAWIAFAILLVVAVLGWTMFAICRRRGAGCRSGHARRAALPGARRRRARDPRCHHGRARVPRRDRRGRLDADVERLCGRAVLA